MSLLSELREKVKAEYREYILRGKKGRWAVTTLARAYKRGESTIWRYLHSESK